MKLPALKHFSATGYWLRGCNQFQPLTKAYSINCKLEILPFTWKCHLQMASLMSTVAAQQVKAEKDRLIQARNIDESEKWLYVQVSA